MKEDGVQMNFMANQSAIKTFVPTSWWLQRKSQGINKVNGIHCKGTQDFYHDDVSVKSRYIHKATLLAYLQNLTEIKQCLVLYYTETFFHFRNKQWNWPGQFRNSFHLSRLKRSGEVAAAEIGHFSEESDRWGFHQPVTDQASWQVSVSLHHISEELRQLSLPSLGETFRTIPQTSQGP